MFTTPHHDDLARKLARQIFPQARSLRVNRVTLGVSTWVYCIRLNSTRFYLRILPEEGASFAPEVYVHTRLMAVGLRVPEVIYFEHQNELFARSVMMTTEIQGAPIAHDASPQASPQAMTAVLREAGRELAVLNQVAVDGFGWVTRTAAAPDNLCGESAIFGAWMRGEMEEALLEGYREVAVLPVDYATQIKQAALLIAVGRAARRLARKRSILDADRQVILHSLHNTRIS